MKKAPEARRIRLPVAMLNAAEAIYDKVPPANCKGLCRDCCGPVFMEHFEWDRIAARVGHHPRPTAEQRARLDCPLLTEAGQCSVYDVRPLICRLWGSAEGMPCPFGCEPDGGRLSDAQAQGLIDEMHRANERHYEA